MTTAILLLAAGSSSRMGQSKQLLKVRGETLLRMTSRIALAVSPVTFVVLGSNFTEHKKAIGDLPLSIIENKDWQRGMGSSLKSGLSALLKKNDVVDSLIVLVCDQPNLSEAHLRKLIARSVETNATVIASSYAGTTGVPALFRRSSFELLLQTNNEEGAKKIIKQLSPAVDAVDFPGGDADLDTRDDYDAFVAGR